MTKFDVCIIGGGAAGLAAAASLSEQLKVCIFEKNEIPGRKLMATGGGRCNITNDACEGKKATLDFFASIGLETHMDEAGRFYPYTNKAADVQKALLRAQGPNVTSYCGYEVETVVADCAGDGSRGFLITAKAPFNATASANVKAAAGAGDPAGPKLTVRADFILLATGGKAAPQYGTTGDGYRIAKSFGHHVNKVYPILAPVECVYDPEDEAFFRKVKGIRAKAEVTLLKDVEPVPGVKPERGELQFTEDGLSGICIFDLTPYITAEEGEVVAKAMERYSISVDLAPDFSEETLRKRTTCRGLLTEELADAADEEMEQRGCGPELIKDWRFTVKNVKGWRHAQCTAGGIDTGEIDPATMESRLVPGLYFAGEVIDVQGPCGGFNLQNAWETGRKAAAAINKKIIKTNNE